MVGGPEHGLDSGLPGPSELLRALVDPRGWRDERLRDELQPLSDGEQPQRLHLNLYSCEKGMKGREVEGGGERGGGWEKRG